MAIYEKRLYDLTVTVSNHFNTLRSLISGGASTLDALQTQDKSNLVGAINEIKGQVDQIGTSSGGGGSSTPQNPQWISSDW